MNYDNIPMELRKLHQWVGVRPDSKVPHDALYHRPASTANPQTWTNFLTAADRYPQVGFVFHDNGLVGIDIDDGWNEDGFLSNLALDCISMCQSYTEKSRSGRGFHIIVRGDIPFKGKNNRKGLEIYKSGRYFIMTGDKMIYDSIVENQKALDYIVEKYFTEESGEEVSARIYNPIWERVQGHKIRLRPTYPSITPGSRNICLTSLAGMLHTQGYTYEDMLRELDYANGVACDPPLSYREVQMIAESVSRYRR